MKEEYQSVLKETVFPIGSSCGNRDTAYDGTKKKDGTSLDTSGKWIGELMKLQFREKY
jgi:hypothetical protein